MSKRTYFRISTFALGSTDGGYWEADEVVSGNTPEEAFKNVLSWISSLGFAYETTIALCKANGEDFDE